MTQRPTADGPRQRQHTEPILRAYLKRWAFEVGAFFEGVNGDASAQELARIAPNHPVFHLS